MVQREVKSAFGTHFIENDWTDDDWEKYQFNLKLVESMGWKCVRENRHFNKDEREFIRDREAENDGFREKYGVVD